MPFSYKIKRLLIISLFIIIIALASNEGDKAHRNEKRIYTTPKLTYSNLPKMDSNIIDLSIGKVSPRSEPVSTKPAVPRPLISAESYLVANLETGEIYSDHASEKIFPIASLSKLITALVALELMSPDHKIAITQSMLDAYGEAGHLVLGEILTINDLLYPLLLESSNDAAEALAQSYGYDGFINKMNAYTAGLKMGSTKFNDPSGLSSGNSSNATDLFILAQHIYKLKKPLLDISRQVTWFLASTTEHGTHTWKTINPFPLDPHFIGGKTGRTNEAKESMISLFRYEKAGTVYPVAIIVLRSDFKAREIDSSLLFEKFFNKIGGI